jgi:aspartate dehydrogenase
VTPQLPRPERVGFIGLGPLARETLVALGSHGADRVAVVAILVRDPARERPETGRLEAPLVSDLADLLRCAPTVVVELAGHAAVQTHVPAILRAGVDVLITSVGALVDDALRNEIRRAAEAGGSTARIPPGAIGGLDAIAAARLIGLDLVRHTIRKAPHSLLPASEADQVIAGGQPVELFRGSAREAVARFPASTNVTATLAIAGAGFEATEAVVIADPGVVRNHHRVEAVGPFGRIALEMENERVPNSTSGAIVVASTVRSILDRSAALAVD